MLEFITKSGKHHYNVGQFLLQSEVIIQSRTVQCSVGSRTFLYVVAKNTNEFTQTYYRITTVTCICQIFQFYYDILLDVLFYIKTSYSTLGCPILHQDVLFYIKTSYFTLRRLILHQDVLFYTRTSYFTLGRPIVHQDVLFFIRTSYTTLGRPILHQEVLVLFYIRTSYFTLGHITLMGNRMC